MLVASRSWLESGIHVHSANKGLKEIEISVAVYCGVPVNLEAMKAAGRTINEIIANGEHKRQLDELPPPLQNS